MAWLPQHMRPWRTWTVITKSKKLNVTIRMYSKKHIFLPSSKTHVVCSFHWGKAPKIFLLCHVACVVACLGCSMDLVVHFRHLVGCLTPKLLHADEVAHFWAMCLALPPTNMGLGDVNKNII